jgi:hypothetical protein
MEYDILPVGLRTTRAVDSSVTPAFRLIVHVTKTSIGDYFLEGVIKHEGKQC